MNELGPALAPYLKRQKIGFPLGVALFALVLALPAPPGLAPEAQRAAAVAVLMAAWWVSETLPLAATALIPLALFPVLGVLPIERAAAPYANPNVFLFMGGFMLALAMQKWGLHRRLALHVLLRVGGGPRRTLLGFMAATAFLSMWVSNTATAVMMLPIALAVVGQTQSPGQRAEPGAAALLLGVAYAASVGGVATLIGTPPNLIFAGQVEALLPELGPVGFVRWLAFGLPLALGFLLIVWLYLGRALGPLPPGGGRRRAVLRQTLARMGPWSRGERGALAVFVAAALAWTFRGDLALGGVVLPGWASLLGLEGVHDATVAIVAALLLFAIPVDFKRVDFLLDWHWAQRLPWHVLLLFGGGFALAEGVQHSGLADWLAGGVALLGGAPVWLLVLGLCLAVTFLTEVTSNTATATMLMPVLAAAASPLGVHPFLLMVPVAVSASFAFMLPTATPPNAVVFAGGQLSVPQMARAGLALNLLGALWITALTFLLGGPVFGF